MKYSYTVQTLEQDKGPDVWAVRYEGPLESNAKKMFEKMTAGKPAVIFTVELNSRQIYRDVNEGQAKRAFYDSVQSLQARGQRGGTVRFIAIGAGWAATYTVRPFEERLMGGDPQHARTKTQFSDPD